jgi:protein Mpv17
MMSSQVRRVFSSITALGNNINTSINTRAAPKFDKWYRYGDVRYYAQQYGKALEEYPLLTKSVSGFVIGGAGDLTCQAIVRRRNNGGEWDFVSPARFAILGALWVAPTGHFWYEYLAKFGKSRVAVLKRVALDQFLFKPFSSVVFLSTLSVMEGVDRGEIFHRVRQNLPESLVKEWQHLIPAQIINFRFVPTAYQVLFCDLFEALWTIHMSLQTKEKEIEEIKEDAEEVKEYLEKQGHEVEINDNLEVEVVKSAS